MNANFSYAIIYLEILALCLIVTAVIRVKASRDMGSEREVETFKLMLSIFMVMLVVDAFTQLHYKQLIKLPIGLLSVLYSCYMFLLGLLAFLWLYFAEQRIDRPIRRKNWFWGLMITPLILYAVICFGSIWTHWLYNFDSNGIYMRGPLFALQNAIAYFYFFLSTVHALIIGMHEKSRLRRTKLFHLAAFLVAPAGAGILQLFVGGYPFVAPGICIAIIFIFVSIQGALIHTDSLTDLNNRKRMEAIYEDMLQQTSEEAPFYVYMMDIDRFKRINDTYGHVAGDRALRIFADSLRLTEQEIRGYVGRYGGDEFIAFVQAANVGEPRFFTEVLARHLEAACKEKECSYTLSASTGWSKCTSPETRLEDLVADADEMLYRNKQKEHLSGAL